MSIPLTINSEPSLGIQAVFIEEKQLQTSLLSKQNQEPDNFLSTFFESIENSNFFPVFVGLKQQDCYQTFYSGHQDCVGMEVFRRLHVLTDYRPA